MGPSAKWKCRSLVIYKLLRILRQQQYSTGKHRVLPRVMARVHTQEVSPAPPKPEECIHHYSQLRAARAHLQDREEHFLL